VHLGVDRKRAIVVCLILAQAGGLRAEVTREIRCESFVIVMCFAAMQQGTPGLASVASSPESVCRPWPYACQGRAVKPRRFSQKIHLPVTVFKLE